MSMPFYLIFVYFFSHLPYNPTILRIFANEETSETILASNSAQGNIDENDAMASDT